MRSDIQEVIPLSIRNTLLCSLSTLAISTVSTAALADCADPIKVGVLHSLSGSMAISETTLKDAMLMLIEQQNAKGGLLGCELEAVVVDPASDWPLFAEKARELLTVNEVDVIFGNWTSVSRKSVITSLKSLALKNSRCLAQTMSTLAQRTTSSNPICWIKASLPKIFL